MSQNLQDALHRAGLTQTQFGEIIERLSGYRINRQRPSNWVNKGKLTEVAIALAELLAEITPSERERILEKRITNGTDHLTQRS